VFWANVPVGIFGTLWAYRKLRDNGERHPGRIDWWGNITFAAGLSAILIGITGGLQPFRHHTMGWANPVRGGPRGEPGPAPAGGQRCAVLTPGREPADPYRPEVLPGADIRAVSARPGRRVRRSGRPGGAGRRRVAAAWRPRPPRSRRRCATGRQCRTTGRQCSAASSQRRAAGTATARCGTSGTAGAAELGKRRTQDALTRARRGSRPSPGVASSCW
jgi:hypothetical protein